MNNFEVKMYYDEQKQRQNAQKLAQKHAKDLIIFAHLGNMPSTFWHTDRKIAAACDSLGWTTEFAQNWEDWDLEDE